jgi:hypothetical protein
MLKVCVAVLGAAGAPAFAQILNGGFEAGNTGFTSQYQYVTVSTPPYVGQYGVTHTSFEWTQFWSTLGGDHTTGSGLFLIADTQQGPTIWAETVTVLPNTQYELSAWLATWSTFPAATLGVEIDGQLVGQWAGPGGPTWTHAAQTFTTGNTGSASIRLFATTSVQPGGDIAIDDIALNVVPAPSSAAALALSVLGLRRRRR